MRSWETWCVGLWGQWGHWFDIKEGSNNTNFHSLPTQLLGFGFSKRLLTALTQQRHSFWVIFSQLKEKQKKKKKNPHCSLWFQAFPLMENHLHHQQQQLERQPNSMKSRFRRVCVFCGSSPGKNPSYQLAAIQLGKQLVQKQKLLPFFFFFFS